MKISKILMYARGQARVYLNNLKHFGIRYAHWNFWGEFASKLNLGTLASKVQAKKRKCVLHYLKNITHQMVPSNISRKELGKSPKIWMFWWTGIDTAPDIVKISVNSVKANSNGFDVCILDQDNYQDYVSLPSYIIEKHNNGIITHAMFSDILRTTLLSLYGGVWIDATIICLRALPDELKTTEFYTCKTYNKNSLHVSKSRWTAFFLAGQPEFKLFSRARDLLFTYWRINDVQIDYLLIDYVLEYVRVTDPEVRKKLDCLPDNNLKRNELFNRLNEPYSDELLNEYLYDETFVYKCSWRYGTLSEFDENGNLTLYGFLKNNYLKKFYEW